MTDPRLTAVEYLGLIGAVSLLESYAADEPTVYGASARAANRALSKIRFTLSPAAQRELQRRLTPPEK